MIRSLEIVIEEKDLEYKRLSDKLNFMAQDYNNMIGIQYCL